MIKPLIQAECSKQITEIMGVICIKLYKKINSISLVLIKDPKLTGIIIMSLWAPNNTN